MLKLVLATLLLASGFSFVPATAQAQVSFALGPKLGYNLSTTHFTGFGNGSTSYRSGVEAGLVGMLTRQHFTLQAAVLYAQKGYQLTFIIPGDAFTSPLYYEGNTRLNYVTLPINLAYTQHANGQGFQVFAGPYLGLLLGGHYQSSFYIDDSGYTGGFQLPPSITTTVTGRVSGGDYNPTSYQTYSKRVDAGLQAGVGYRYGHLLVQADYSLGLRNISHYQFANVGLREIPYYNRAFQASLSYLFGPNS